MKKKTKAVKKNAKTTVTKTTVTTTTTTTTTTGKLKNRIGIVLDASGSMASMREEIVKAFNGQVDTMLANNKDMDTKVTLLPFSTTPDDYKVFNEPLDNIKKLTVADYVCDGWTALYDAIGKMTTYFESLPEASDPNCSFLLVILTDGMENQSKHWSFPNLTKKIKQLEATGRWTFTYLGAAEGLADVGVSLGMSAGNTISGKHLRMPGAYSTVAVASASNFMSTRSAGGQSVKNFYSGNGTSGQADPNDPNSGVTVTTTTTVKPKAKQSTS